MPCDVTITILRNVKFSFISSELRWQWGGLAYAQGQMWLKNDKILVPKWTVKAQQVSVIISRLFTIKCSSKLLTECPRVSKMFQIEIDRLQSTHDRSVALFGNGQPVCACLKRTYLIGSLTQKTGWKVNLIVSFYFSMAVPFTVDIKTTAT